MNTTQIEQLVASIPVWEHGVWKGLQSKKYSEAAGRLRDVLEYLTEPGLAMISWGLMVRGVPSVRGVLSQEEWNASVLPMLGWAFLSFASTNQAGRTYGALDFVTLKRFHLLVVGIIPGAGAIEKAESLKAFNSPLYPYLVASPSQVLGLGLFKRPDQYVAAPEYLESAQQNLPDELRSTLFSGTTALSVLEVAREHSLSDIYASALGNLVGAMLLGIVPENQVGTEVEKLLPNAPRASLDGVTQKIKEFLKPYESSIRPLGGEFGKAPEAAGHVRLEELSTPQEKGVHSIPVRPTQPFVARPPFVGKSTSPLSTPTTSTPTSRESGVGAPTGASGSKTVNQPQPPAVRPLEPLMLHEERGSSPSTPSAPSTFPQPKKHFSILNFLKPKTPPSPNITVKARIETPGAPAAPTSKGPPKRVVYYSDARTPVSPIGGPVSSSRGGPVAPASGSPGQTSGEVKPTGNLSGSMNLDTLGIIRRPTPPMGTPMAFTQTPKGQAPAVPAAPAPSPAPRPMPIATSGPVTSAPRPFMPPQKPAAPPSPAPTQPPQAPPASPFRPIPPSPPPPAPKLDGNTIDLRQK